MNVRGKTLEELYDIEIDLKMENEMDYGYYSKLISIYKAMINLLLAKERDKLEEEDLICIKERLVDYLIKYGTYQKTSLEKNRHEAKRALKEALQLNRKNPIVHYRLGFLAYQEEDYLEALKSFHHTVKYREFNSTSKYLLNELQLYYAQLYLTNSALQIAEKTQQKIKPPENKPKPLPYETSPYLPLIQRNEEELLSNAFYYQTREGRKTCSKEECDNFFEQSQPEIVLYFGDREIYCKFGGLEKKLSINQGYILYLLLNSSVNKPRTRQMFTDYFELSKKRELTSNTFRVRINRFKEGLQRIGVGNLIQQTIVNNETAYYVDESTPYIILYRVDDIAIANLTI